MKNITELQQLINTTEKLVESNQQLVKINADAFELIKENQKKEKDLLAHCGKMYRYLQSKIDQTWEEKESMGILYRLITHS